MTTTDTPDDRSSQGATQDLRISANDPRVAEFKRFVVAHPHLARADITILNAIREPAGSLLVFVFGPTGVGKSTLLAHVKKHLLELAQPLMETNASYLPVVSFSAVAPPGGPFKWSDFLVEGLGQAYEPLLQHKVAYDYRVPAHEEQPVPRRQHRPAGHVSALHQSWKEMNEHRKPDAILIDEAQHIAKVGSGSTRLLDQLDYIKSLAVGTQTVYVLAGTYDLLVLRNLSAQLGRRSVDIHFSRYRHTDDKEREAFQSALYAFQQRLPLEKEPDLVHHWKYFYAHSGGCIGIVKDWLTKALVEALESEAKELTYDMLEHHVLSLDRCEQLFTDIEEGENLLAADATAENRLWQRLGLGKPPSKKSLSSKSKSKGETPGAPKSRARSTQVGKPKATRYPVKGETSTHD